MSEILFTRVPGVTRGTLAEARRRLERDGLATARRDVFDETIPDGTIIAQHPDAGEVVQVGTPVTLDISVGALPGDEDDRLDQIQQTLDGVAQVIRDSGNAT